MKGLRRKPGIRKVFQKKRHPTFESVQSHTLKKISQCIKIIRGQLIQKCIRLINNLKVTDENSLDVQSQVHNLKRLKSLDHNEISKLILTQYIAQRRISIPHNPSQQGPELLYSSENEKFIRSRFANHKKIIEICQIFQSKINGLENFGEESELNNVATRKLISKKITESPSTSGLKRYSDQVLRLTCPPICTLTFARSPEKYY